MTAPFPENYEVGWRTWYSAGKDPIGGDQDRWHDPVQRPVIGWTGRTTVGVSAEEYTKDTDYLRLQVNPDFVWGVKDLVDIPGRGKYEVVGEVDANAGFHRWRPGKVLELTRYGGRGLEDA